MTVRKEKLMWLGAGILIGVSMCSFCCFGYFVFREINGSIQESSLDEQCVFNNPDTLTDADCDAWVERVTTEYRTEFLDCAEKGSAYNTYFCLVDKGVGPID